MSLEQCTVNGKQGWRWGNGKCHIGEGGKVRAEAEGATEVSDEVLSEKLAGMIETVEKIQEAAPKAAVAKKAAPKKKSAVKKK